MFQETSQHHYSLQFMAKIININVKEYSSGLNIVLELVHVICRRGDVGIPVDLVHR